MGALRWRYPDAVADGVLVLLVSFFLAALSIAISREPGSISSLWLPNGAAMALCASAPVSRRPALILLACLAYAMANLAYDSSLLNAVIFLPGNAIEMALGTYIIGRNNLSARFSNGSRLFLLTLVQAVIVPTLLGSAVGAALLDIAGYAGFSRTWPDWFIGVALGSATTLPLALNIRSGASLKEARNPVFWLVLLSTASITLACLQYFPYPFGVISIALLCIAFFRSRLTTFAAAPLVVLVFSITAATERWSPVTEDTPLGHAIMYLTLLFVVIPPQVVAVLIARKHALEETLTAVGSHSGQLAEFIDMQGELRWANRTREIYTGIPNNKSIGRPQETTYQPVVNSLVDAALRGAQSEDTISVKYPRMGQRTMAVRAQPAFDDEHRQIGVLLTCTDVTQQEASKKQLQDLARSLELANKDLKQFLRASSHDLVEPLNTINQFSSLIEQLDPLADWQITCEYLALIQQASARMSATLSDIRTYIQIDEAVSESRFRSLDIESLVQEALEHLERNIKKTQAEVSLQLSGCVLGDKDHLVLAIENLLSNALKFVEPGTRPSIRVTSYRRSSSWVIEVCDKGIGIPQDKLPLLAEPFKRLHSRRNYDGTGLGLAICKRIAHRHGGHLEISSQPDAGSRFSIVLPEKS